MKITVIGSGYVGLVSGICLAKIGHEVTCLDNDKDKIYQLSQGEIPIFEPGLKDLLGEVVAKNRIKFSVNLIDSIKDSKAIFIAVGTPQEEDGSADLKYVLQVAKDLAQNINDDKVIITKSTVPAGTGKKIQEIFLQINPQTKVSIASNPEFLREGFAIDDFMNPDRIVVGVEDEKAKEVLEEIYQYFSQEKLVFCDIITAELIKYASNSFLATKIAFINEMADLCEIVGGDIRQLSYAMGLDSRIGNKFLNPGPGFGGSCFPKDILAILNVSQKNNVHLSLIESVIASNKARINKMVAKIKKALNGDVVDKKIALLGLAFKANTDDIRYSPAIIIAKKLLENRATIQAHDPQAITNSKKELNGFKNIEYFNDYYQAIKDCDLIVIATEWDQYKELDFDKIKQLTKCRVVVDLRNLLTYSQRRDREFTMVSIGK